MIYVKISILPIYQIIFLGSSLNSFQPQCLLFVERTTEVLNEIVYSKITAAPRAASVIVTNLSSEVPLRDFIVSSADVSILTFFLCCYFCLSVLLVSSSSSPSHLSFLLSYESNCSLMRMILSRSWLSAAFRVWSV